MSHRRLFVTCCLSAAFLGSHAEVAHAHPISMSEAIVYVTRSKVTLTVQIFVEDLYFFHNLQPDAGNFLKRDDLKAAIEKHKQFLLDRMLVRDVNGERLVGKVDSVSNLEIQAEGISMRDLMFHQLTYDIEFPLESPPEFLTFSQRLVSQESTFPASVQLQLKQEGSETPYAVALRPYEPHTIRFNWDHPPLSPDASEEAWQTWLAERKRETLGITSYSSAYSFIYITDREVRHEVLIPLLTLEGFFKIERKDREFLDIAEQETARKQIEEFFVQHNPVEIDGIRVQPIVDRLEFYGLDFKDFAKPAEQRRVSTANARVGLILSYGTKGTPSTVKVTWDQFNKYLMDIEAVCFAFDETLKPVFSKIEGMNTFEWKNPGRPETPEISDLLLAPELPPATRTVPALSVVCLLAAPGLLLALRRRNSSTGRRWWIAGVLLFAAALSWPLPAAQVTVIDPFAAKPQLPDQEATLIFATLHKNIYRAFDYRDESEIYDALANSVDGELLGNLYRQIHQGLRMQEQGGAVSRVRAVEILNGQAEPLPEQLESKRTQAEQSQSQQPGLDDRAFAYFCDWTVEGTVEHWGHIHARTNGYKARFIVEPRDGAWKITALEVRAEERVKFETSLREF